MNDLCQNCSLVTHNAALDHSVKLVKLTRLGHVDLLALQITVGSLLNVMDGRYLSACPEDTLYTG